MELGLTAVDSGSGSHMPVQQISQVVELRENSTHPTESELHDVSHETGALGNLPTGTWRSPAVERTTAIENNDNNISQLYILKAFHVQVLIVS